MTKTPRKFKLFLEDIIFSIRKIEKYTQDKDFDEFSNTEIIFDAVIRNIEIIGESSNQIPIKIREKYSQIQWREIIDLRNILIHNYFQADAKIIWNIIKYDIPILKKQIQQIVKDLG